MNVEWLETFLDLVQTRNFNRTAERLHVTQSTVSARVRSLEEAVGTVLFLRGRAGAELTPEGVRFQSYAANMLLCWNSARQDLAMPPGYQNRLRIATQVSLWERLILKWVNWLRSELPRTAVHVEADYSKSMIDELVFGNLDIGVVYAPQYRPELEVQLLFNESFVMVSTTEQSLQDITIDNYIFVGLSAYFISKHAELLPHLQVAPLSVGLGAMSLEYLKTRGGAAYLPTDLASHYIEQGQFFQVADAPVIQQPVFITYVSKNRHRSHIAKALAALRLIATDCVH